MKSTHDSGCLNKTQSFVDTSFVKVLLFELFVPAGVADLKWLGGDPVMWDIESILLMCSFWFGIFINAELLYAQMQVPVQYMSVHCPHSFMSCR